RRTPRFSRNEGFRRRPRMLQCGPEGGAGPSGTQPRTRHESREDTMEARGLSRRAFLQGVGLAAAAGAAGGALAACSPGGAEGGAGGKAPDATAGQEAQAAVEDWAADTEELGEPQEVLNVDVCVVGAGGTGLAASMQSVQNGLSVVCLEKNGAPGGSFICTE